MKSYIQLGVALCVVALSVSAFAGSVTTGSYAASVSGVPNTTVYGTFSYNTSTDTYTSVSLSFVGNSIFGGLSGTVTQPQSGSRFVFDKTVGGYSVSYSILLDAMNPDSYTAQGYIVNGSASGTFGSKHQVPEGGSQISYLLASGLVLFAGILIAGKQRRRLAEN